MVEALDLVGNASSVHAEGRAARARVEAAREAVAQLVGTSARRVIFVSGGTEAAATLLRPGLRRSDWPPGLRTRLLVGAGEHACVLHGHGFGHETRVVRLAANGTLDLADLAAALAEGEGQPVLALQAANNETGVIQPVAEAAALVHAAGGLAVVDAVQAAGKIALTLADLGADALFLSAHKLGGPVGVGAICLRDDNVVLPALIKGGGQERGLRAGTQNVPAIAGFGVAAREAMADLATESARLSALRDDFERRLLAMTPPATIFGAGAQRLPNTSAFGWDGVAAQTLLMRLDLAGCAVSSGSACSSGKVGRSHVLSAMGVPDALADGALRVSLGWATTPQDVIQCAAALEEALAVVQRHGGGGAFRAA
jgi:cysteine desulfurase